MGQDTKTVSEPPPPCFVATMFNRVRQSITEKIGKANATKLDPDLVKTLERLDTFKENKKIVAALNVWLEPDLTVRLKESVTGSGQNETTTKPTKAESLANLMGELDNKLSNKDEYGMALYKVSQAFKEHGFVHNAMIRGTQGSILETIEEVNEGIKELDELRSELEKLRLNMDSMKSKMKKQGGDSLKEEYQRASEAYYVQVSLVRERATSLNENKVEELVKNWNEFAEIQINYASKSLGFFQLCNKQM